MRSGILTRSVNEGKSQVQPLAHASGCKNARFPSKLALSNQASGSTGLIQHSGVFDFVEPGKFRAVAFAVDAERAFHIKRALIDIS